MIALIGPTRLDLTPPVEESFVEIALLVDDEVEVEDANLEEDEVECHELAPWESELLGDRLAELYDAGVVRRRPEGKWLVYEVTPDICRMLLLLLLKRSSAPNPNAWRFAATEKRHYGN